ncbi:MULTISPECIES: polysaccharide deacetylase family protein [Vagococcus]|uniref:polysaccharide deacetylase family protein n=1 Tax=Vagococcus TaxID=2737 RepID=UPI000E4DFD0B|nr:MULTISPECIES: polysaccharide deacetylase family protein [Vagococcus]RHH69507.1 polysaccharide deacetylase family protein [Vagococcus sp. AM17-17]
MKKKALWTIVILLLIELILVGVYFTKNTSQNKKIKTEESSILAKSSSREIKETTTTSETKPGEIDTTDWLTSDTDISFPILMYHSLTVSNDGNTLKLPPEEFKEQMEWLKENDYYTLTPEEAYIVLTENKKPKEKIVWITLDDGYLNNYTDGFPILKQLKLNATINYITSKQDNQYYFHQADMEKMKQSGLISIESHTVSHLDLNTLSDEQIHTELLDSKKWLDDTLKQQTSVICYPAGRYDERVEKEAELTGYKLGLTTEPGYASKNDGLFALKRIRVSPGFDKESFGNYLTSSNQYANN